MFVDLTSLFPIDWYFLLHFWNNKKEEKENSLQISDIWGSLLSSQQQLPARAILYTIAAGRINQVAFLNDTVIAWVDVLEVTLTRKR